MQVDQGIYRYVLTLICRKYAEVRASSLMLNAYQKTKTKQPWAVTIPELTVSWQGVTLQISIMGLFVSKTMCHSHNLVVKKNIHAFILYM